ERENQTSLDENQELQKTIATFEDDREALVQKSAYLENQLQASKKQIEELNQELADRETKLENMTQEHQTLVSQNDNLEEEKESLNLKTQELNRQLEIFKAELDAVAQEAVAKEQKLQALNKSYETLRTQLNKIINEKDMKINALEGRMNISFLDKILFASGQTDISSNGKGVLKSLAEELKKVEGVRISVEGHTDNQPLGRKIENIYIDNLGLSVARSAAVARALVKMGVNPEKISAAGYSMHQPVADNDVPEGRQQNRRVEIILTPSN
ncbi:MAG: OmpA family protein, partial [Desulfobacterales bacterium]